MSLCPHSSGLIIPSRSQYSHRHTYCTDRQMDRDRDKEIHRQTIKKTKTERLMYRQSCGYTDRYTDD
jgi:hypothetical protein